MPGLGVPVSGSGSMADDKWPDPVINDFRELDISSPNSTLHNRPGDTFTITCSSSSSSSAHAFKSNPSCSIPSSCNASQSNPSGSIPSSCNASESSSSGSIPSSSCHASESSSSGSIPSSCHASESSPSGSIPSSSNTSNSSPSCWKNPLVDPQKPFEIQSNLVANKTTSESEEFKQAGNNMYNQCKFDEALDFYDTAIALVPSNAVYKSNRAAALMCLGRLAEAVTECEEAVRLDLSYIKPRERLVSLLIRLGDVDDARKHLGFLENSKQDELRKVNAIAKCISRCGTYRRMGDWKRALREANSAIDSGADACPQVLLCKVEAHLKLHQLAEAGAALMNLPLLGRLPNSSHRYFGMLSEAYLPFVISQIEMASGRFENAVTEAEKARQIDDRNVEVSALLNNVRLVANAGIYGNALVKSDRLTDAYAAYTEGLKADPTNTILRCYRAAALFNLGRYEQCIDDCNQTLLIQPRCQRAILERAAANTKLERWADAVSDYELLIKIVPHDINVKEYLFHAQLGLTMSGREDTQDVRFSGKVENVTTLARFKDAISFSGVSMVHFKQESNAYCKDISPFVDELCKGYRTMNFLVVDIEKCPSIAMYEKISGPTFQVYREGRPIRKNMTGPSRERLLESVKDYQRNMTGPSRECLLESVKDYRF